MNYTEAYQSKNGITHATKTSGLTACGIGGAYFVNRTYKYTGQWNNATNPCGKCTQAIEKGSCK